MNREKICYIVPKTEDFREERPRICWEHMYGWIDGYAVLFDPIIQKNFTSVPEFSNGIPQNIEADHFYITSTGLSSSEFLFPDLPGLFICPHSHKLKISRKERLVTPHGKFFYPQDLPYENSSGNDENWKLGEKSVLFSKGDRHELYFEFFTMAGYMLAESPYKRLLTASEMLASIFQFDYSAEDRNVPAIDIRLDCQSYGLARLFMQWLFRLLKQDTEEVKTADHYYLEAVRQYHRKKYKEAAKELRRAFQCLYQLRIKYIALDFRFVEYPHAGILFRERGFFELEWPEGSRQIISALLHDAHACNYHVGFELGANCWAMLHEYYPGLLEFASKLWKQGNIELVNGTYSLPYAFVSPLLLQYWQFVLGHNIFRMLFNKIPDIYQCQENSFTPQMPELLVHFGYRGVIHASQNHGSPPYEETPAIRWESPAGTGIPALCCASSELIRKGVNFFWDIPLLLFKYRDKKAVNAFNFMDLSYIPLREFMIRIAKYAPVFGRFVKGSELFEEQKELPVRKYLSDDYHFSCDAFYHNYTNSNAISQYEHTFRLAYEWRVLQMLDSGNYLENQYVAMQLCSLEAHDVRVQGQRPGEFYTKRTNETSPYSRETLSDLLARKRASLRQYFDEVYRKVVFEKSGQLFNPSELPLPFAEIKQTENYHGACFKFSNRCYASGDFPPLSIGKNADPSSNSAWRESIRIIKSGKWTIELIDDKVSVIYNKIKAVFSVTDHLNGDFHLRKALLRTNGFWLTVELFFDQLKGRMDSILLEGITTTSSDYIEWHLRYASSSNFIESARWDDYLALTFETGETTKLFNFVPNMLCETHEEKICSSGCLQMKDRSENSFSLLFDGLGNFHRSKNNLNWLFHVANESVYERKMAISFGNNPPYLLGRALQSGLYPVNELPRQLPLLSNPCISIEHCIASGKWLISNVSEQRQRVKLPNGTHLTAMDDSILEPPELSPWQLAILVFDS